MLIALNIKLLLMTVIIITIRDFRRYFIFVLRYLYEIRFIAFR